ncbi:MAG: bifunctional 4-hydroxy-3-methylbut-2-enyl diphosphate reductase/30S ribosomal protein S1 [Oscillospiraceae bacterium]|nr:bifunctional 4-hydroxy-3-methylbut-2-enyl diphosphate reductase/30S ribosomal protein S1 [Oscillospiraceae bacterium]
MNVIVAKTAGFCFGVSRAVSICEKEAGKWDNCVTLGPIIHNSHVISHFEDLGIMAVDNIDEIKPGSTVIIRSHGAAKKDYERLESIGANIIDATCPDVSKIHEIVRRESENNRIPVIIGEVSHPEVIAICGWCDEHEVFESGTQLLKWLETNDNANKALSFVFQTTSNSLEYHSIVEIIKKECTNSKVFDTICNATSKRQQEAEELSKIADCVIVIGDPNSANSRRLANISEKFCQRVYFIESANQLDGLDIRESDTICITAGASTPAWIIKEVNQIMSDDVRQEDGNLDATQEEQSTIDETSVALDSVDSEIETDDQVSMQDTATLSDEPTVDESDDGDDSVAPQAQDISTSEDTDGVPLAEGLADDLESTDTVSQDEAVDLTIDEETIIADSSSDSDDSFFDDASGNEESFEEMLEKSIITPLQAGQRVTGVVTSITSTEVSVDLGTKQSGYIPISEFTDDQNSDAEDMVNIGDTIESFVMRVNDVEGMVMLSKKRLDAIRNWTDIEAAKDARTIVEGVVSEENKGGVIVNIKGVRVFIPASQTGLPKSTPMTELVRTNVRLIVTEVNQSRRRVVGSIRAVQAEERREKAELLWEEIEVGKQYDGVVKSMTSYGVFVDIGGVDGMIHISELSWTRIKQPSEVMSIGDEVSVYVLSFDKESRKISLGYKKAQDNPWTKFVEAFSVGDIANVKIVKMMPFGAFAEVYPGVDGLIHISQITDHRIGLPSEVLSDGQQVDVKITEIDYDRKKISLSIRALLSPGSLPISDVEIRSATVEDDDDRSPVIVFDTDSPSDYIDDAQFDEAADDSTVEAIETSDDAVVVEEAEVADALDEAVEVEEIDEVETVVEPVEAEESADETEAAEEVETVEEVETAEEAETVELEEDAESEETT